jgi:cellulose synthase/poly-beta-1,6-N-acetylglucosamine synthase-like glycosyltransferase
VPVAAATIRGLAWFCIGYFVVLNSAYLLLLTLAAGSAVLDRSRVRFGGLAEIFASPLAPPISLIVPVCNMADLIVGSTRGLLGLRYPEFEVIVVDDGSTDATFSRLQAEFGLVPIDKVIRDEPGTGGRVLSVHAPRDGGSLLVIRKQGAGRPADAVNVGVGAAQYPLICRVDADTYLDTDALLTVAKPFIEDPAGVVAAGATIRVANGSGIRSGRVTRPRVAGGWLLPIQTAEYLRSFLLGRAGWSQIRGMLFISGAFAVYRRDIYELAGGFGPGSDGDDLEMTLRIHRRLRDERRPYRIGFVPEPCCWRVVPHSYRRLAEQRTQWSRTLAEALWAQRAMLFNPGYGRIGLLVLPFCVVFELVSAVMELLAVAVFGAGLLLGFLRPEMALLAAAVGLGYGALLTIASVICEELTYHRYHSWRDLALLLYAAVAENAGFRQLHAWWRLRGIAGAVLHHRANWAEEPGRRGQSGPAFGMPAGKRHAGVP